MLILIENLNNNNNIKKKLEIVDEGRNPQADDEPEACEDFMSDDIVPTNSSNDSTDPNGSMDNSNGTDEDLVPSNYIETLIASKQIL